MYMRKCGLSCRPASICLSVMLLDCIHVAEDIVQLLVRLYRPITLVF